MSTSKLYVPTPVDLMNKRTELGMSQTELAERAGYTQQTVSYIENGKANPSYSTLRDIVQVLNERTAEARQ